MPVANAIESLIEVDADVAARPANAQSFEQKLSRGPAGALIEAFVYELLWEPAEVDDFTVRSAQVVVELFHDQIDVHDPSSEKLGELHLGFGAAVGVAKRIGLAPPARARPRDPNPRILAQVTRRGVARKHRREQNDGGPHEGLHGAIPSQRFRGKDAPFVLQIALTRSQAAG